jgi:HAD superfamily hydrolase (TIGR01509 family)
MPLRAVFFDVGETLIDETRMFHGWADTMGISRTDFMAVLDDVIAKGEPHRQVFERLRPGFDVAAAAAERKRTGSDFKIEQRDLYHDASTCLSALTQQGWFVGIAGNQPRSASAALTAFGLDARLITTSAELGVDKPSPEFFRLILEKAGFSAGETLYVGDRVDNDVLPAHAFGMTTALLERGPWGRNHARLPGADLADIRVRSLAELPDAIRHLRSV